SFDFCFANLKLASSAGTSIPSESLKPTARFFLSSSVYSTLMARPLSTTQYSAGGYALLGSSVVPAPPLFTASFVAQHGLLCQTRKQSIAETVFWANSLTHYNNDNTNPAQDQLDFWQYPGFPPASRVLNGAYYSGQKPGVYTKLTRWTWGCHGTTGLLKSMLR